MVAMVAAPATVLSSEGLLSQHCYVWKVETQFGIVTVARMYSAGGATVASSVYCVNWKMCTARIEWK